MNTSTLADPKEVVALQLVTLREYATRAVLQGEGLCPDEEADKADRMREFLATGESLKLTPREMVGLVYRGLFRRERECGCHSCGSRE